MQIANPEKRLDECALVVVDVQLGFDDPRWGRRNNPDCERNVALLIAEWRRRGRPVIFVRHDSLEPGSPLAAGSRGNQFKEAIDGEPDLVVVKHVNSAFYGEPNLDRWLGERNLRALAVCGITTDHCCETTARMADNLGYDVLFVSDATHTFDRTAPDGSSVTAEELQRATETSLNGEFATIVKTSDLVPTRKSADD